LSSLKKFDADKRTNKRFEYWGPVVIHLPGSSTVVRAQASDLNQAGGIGLNIEGDFLKVDQELVIEFESGATLEPFSVNVKVANLRKNDKGITVGLKVTHISKLAESRIENFIKDVNKEKNTWGT
jgi:hypothetical protein